jgi:hypothetical protein
MVKDDIWHAAWPDYSEQRARASAEGKRVFLLLCFDCLSKRLGRVLCMEDFAPVPINRAIRLGYELAHEK